LRIERVGQVAESLDTAQADDAVANPFIGLSSTDWNMAMSAANCWMSRPVIRFVASAISAQRAVSQSVGA